MIAKLPKRQRLYIIADNMIYKACDKKFRPFHLSWCYNIHESKLFLEKTLSSVVAG